MNTCCSIRTSAVDSSTTSHCFLQMAELASEQRPASPMQPAQQLHLSQASPGLRPISEQFSEGLANDKASRAPCLPFTSLCCPYFCRDFQQGF